jgi:hypothetical protein
VLENFRIFKKWTLELIRNNPEIFAFGAPEAVFVNLPDNLSAIFPNELAESTVNFTPLTRSDVQSHDVALELFGGFSTKKLNLKNNF